MAKTCPKCNSSAIYQSRRRPQDGLRRLLFYSPVRCHTCTHRHFRFSLWSVAATAGIALLIGLSVGIAYTVISHVADSATTAATPQQ